MNETSAALATARWPLTEAGETDWLRDLADDDGLTGFMPPALPDAAWVLHSMYEHELGPTDMSYVAYQRAVLNGGGPEIIPGLVPADVFEGTPGEPRGPRWSGPARSRMPRRCTTTRRRTVGPRPTSGPRTGPGSSALTTTSGPPKWRALPRSSRRS